MANNELKILAIDDNADNIFSLKALIREAFPEAEFISALSGQTGIELAHSEDPDVILLDIIMPNMNGYEVCMKLKKDERLRDIPVVFLTAFNTDRVPRIRALECGAEAFLTKPIDEIELTAQIRAMAKIRKANVGKRIDKENLTNIVNKQIVELRKNNIEMLSLLEDLGKENEARKKSEEMVTSQRNTLSAIFETSPFIMMLVDMDGHITKINNSGAVFTGKSEEKIIQQPCGMAFNCVNTVEGDICGTQGFCDNCTINSVILSTFKNAEAIKDKEGTLTFLVNEKLETINILVSGNLVHIPIGNQVLVSIVNITDRKQTEIKITKAKEKAEENEKRLSDILFSMSDWVWEIDENGYYIYSSQHGADILGANIIGKTPFDFMPEDEAKRMGPIFAELAAKKLPVKDLENWNINKNGELVCLLTNGVPILDHHGNLKGYRGVNTDITESKKQKQKLIQAMEKAMESDRLKTAFLHNMSHEIRTPMNAIMGFSQLLVRDYATDAKLEKFTNIIEEGCNDLLQIIDDILDISKIESGTLAVKMEECNLSVLFEELIFQFGEYQQRYNKQHIEFSMDACFSQSKSVIITDKRKLKQIFVNLITNAFKFTNTGSIEGGCRVENDKLIFYVTDTGIGIPDDKLHFVFERFAQLIQDKNQTIPGTGLGLAITKGLVALMGGEMFLESESGKGTTFSFTIPGILKPALHTETIDANQATDSKYEGKTILIVEDNTKNAEFLTELLSVTGADILLAETGNDAVKLALNQSVDLILMDIQLPDIDGYEALLQIRLHKPDCKAIAQTAYAAIGDKQKALDSGFNDYISKPIMPKFFFPMIHKYLS